MNESERILRNLWNRASIHGKQTGRTVDYEIAQADAAAAQMLMEARLAGAKQIVDSLTQEHDSVKKSNAITLPEQHGYFYAVRDASLELAALSKQTEGES